MANIIEISQFDSEIYQIETGDPVLGGVSGVANTQAKALANRTQFLFSTVQSVSGSGNTTTSEVTGARGNFATLSDRLTAMTGETNTVTAEVSGARQGFANLDARLNDITFGSNNYANDTGAADAYVVTLTPAPTGYSTGLAVYFKALNANTGASTLNVNSYGVINIKKNVTSALEVGDILVGQIVEVRYDGTNFQIISGAGGSGGINEISIRPYNMSVDGTDTGVATGSLFGMIDTMDFDPNTVGSIWTSLSCPTGWESNTISFDMYYAFSGADENKQVKMQVDAWTTPISGADVVGTPDKTSSVLTLTVGPSATYLDKLFLTEAVSGISLSSGDGLVVNSFVTYRVKRLATDGGDTYTGNLQLAEIRLKV